MKKWLLYMTFIVISIIILAGCSQDTSEKGTTGQGSTTTDNSDDTEDSDDNETNDDKGKSKADKKDNEADKASDNNNSEYEIVTFEAEILEVGDSLLVTPEEGSDAYGSSDKITFSLSEVTIIGEDGKEITKEELLVGDLIRVTYNGVILESYPAQISASAVVVLETNRLLSGYLALIDNIYQQDSALNYDITMIAFDTTEWKDISEEEKAYLFQKVKKRYQVDVVEGTFKELGEQGLIDTDNLYFEKGILIKISKLSYSKDNKRIRCSIEKWRSGKGAIGSDDVTATYEKGPWKIEYGRMWIS